MNVEQKLTPTRVEEVFTACLFADGEDTSNHVKAEGFLTTVGFHPERLEARSNDIVEMLGELPDSFKSSGGEGMSFLEACEDRHGNLWTGNHHSMEQLFQLGLAIGKVSYPFPREVWEALPGGMPYYVVLDVTSEGDDNGSQS